MDKDVLFLVDASSLELSEEADKTSGWVHALPVGTYKHPVYGDMAFDADKISAFAENVKTKVRGIDPSINYIHGVAQTGGDGEAAGWVKDAEARPDGLWVFVEWIKDAAQAIKDKKWKYFSAELHDKWKDATGKEHRNVLFGGALTNRPYMKNLLPINLSENTIDAALELAGTITQARADQMKGKDMDLKKLNELLGLPADSPEETTLAKLAELKTSKVETPPATKPVVPAVSVSEELKTLSEDNPLVKALLDTVDAQQKALTDFQVSLRESDVNAKLAEFDKSKIVLTPQAKDIVHDLAMELPTELAEKFWHLLTLMRSSSGMLVELGERAGVTPRYGRSKDNKSLFMDEVARVRAEVGADKVSLTEAMDQVARANPALYEGYRQASFSFVE